VVNRGVGGSVIVVAGVSVSVRESVCMVVVVIVNVVVFV
jgi:hypothetical protein